MLLEVDAILKSKLLSYVSADMADIDPVTQNSLLMGWPDGLLPHVVYPETDILSRKCLRHSQILTDQTRQKWQSSPPDLQDKAVFMLVELQLAQVQWPVGRVVKVQ